MIHPLSEKLFAASKNLSYLCVDVSNSSLMIYQLTYELRTPDFPYSDFLIFLESGLQVETYRAFRDTWWIDAKSLSLDDLRLKIKENIGQDDIFFISTFNVGDFNGWMPSSAWQWLNTALKNDHQSCI